MRTGECPLCVQGRVSFAYRGVSLVCTGGVSLVCTGGVSLVCTGGVSLVRTGGVSLVRTGEACSLVHTNISM